MSAPALLPSERPASVGLAVKLILLSLALGVPRGYLEWSQVRDQFTANPHVSTQMMATVMVGIIGFILVLMLWLTVMIGKGRNWARITFLVLFLLGAPFSILPLVQSFSLFPLSASLGLAQMALQIIALILLFGADARRWFAGPSAPPAVPI